MAKVRDYIGWGENGKFTPDNLISFKREFMRSKTRMVVSVKKYSPKRSNPANAYYHGVVVRMIGEEIEGEDYDHDSIHEMLKLKHNAIISVSKSGVEVPVGKSTVADSDEFWAFIKRVKQWAQDFLSVYIPEPNEEVSQLMMDRYIKRVA